MYSSEDLERFYFQYQTEAMPKGLSIEQFCSRNKVPYNIFYKWYKDTRNKIVEVKVDGLPTSSQEEPKQESRFFIFAFLKDGNLPIDNNLAERAIRPLTT